MSTSSSINAPGRLNQRHKRTPSIPLRVRSTSLGHALPSTTLSPSSADIPPAEPFRGNAPNVHAALPQKASEKYGFVVYVGSLIAWFLFLFWSFTPDRYIKAVGIEWYPDRWAFAAITTCIIFGLSLGVHCRKWALLVPSWLMASVVYVYIAYFSLNLYHTPALSSMTCITDTQGKLHPQFKPTQKEAKSAQQFPPYSIRQEVSGYEEDYIPPLYDLPVSLVNQAVFGPGIRDASQESSVS